MENFLDKCYKRLEAGAREYGDRSFYKGSDALVEEIKEEAYDVANWAAVMSCTGINPEAELILKTVANKAQEIADILEKSRHAGLFDDRKVPEIGTPGLAVSASDWLTKNLSG